MFLFCDFESQTTASFFAFCISSSLCLSALCLCVNRFPPLCLPVCLAVYVASLFAIYLECIFHPMFPCLQRLWSGCGGCEQQGERGHDRRTPSTEANAGCWRCQGCSCAVTKNCGGHRTGTAGEEQRSSCSTDRQWHRHSCVRAPLASCLCKRHCSSPQSYVIPFISMHAYHPQQRARG